MLLANPNFSDLKCSQSTFIFVQYFAWNWENCGYTFQGTAVTAVPWNV